jgi:hypothetical protein
MEELRSSIDLSSYIAPLSARRGGAGALSPCLSESALSPCPADSVGPDERRRPAGTAILYCDPLSACEAVHSGQARQAEELRAAREEAAALRESMMRASEDHEKRVRETEEGRDRGGGVALRAKGGRGSGCTACRGARLESTRARRWPRLLNRGCLQTEAP